MLAQGHTEIHTRSAAGVTGETETLGPCEDRRGYHNGLHYSARVVDTFGTFQLALGDGQDEVRAGKKDEDSHSSNRPKHLPMAFAVLLFQDPRDHGFLGLGSEGPIGRYHHRTRYDHRREFCPDTGTESGTKYDESGKAVCSIVGGIGQNLVVLGA